MIEGYVDIISDGNKGHLSDYKTSDDGRKEEKMADKYVVSHEFMNTLKIWKDTLFSTFIDEYIIEKLPSVVNDWWLYGVSY